MSIPVVEQPGYLTDLLLLAVAVAAISVTMTRSSLTLPLRRRWPIWGCTYCMIHWVAAVPMVLHAISRPDERPELITAVVVWFILIGLAALFAGILQRLWLLQEIEIARLREGK